MTAVPRPPRDLDHHLRRPPHHALEPGARLSRGAASSTTKHRMGEPGTAQTYRRPEGVLEAGGDAEVVHGSADQ